MEYIYYEPAMPSANNLEVGQREFIGPAQHSTLSQFEYVEVTSEFSRRPVKTGGPDPPQVAKIYKVSAGVVQARLVDEGECRM